MQNKHASYINIYFMLICIVNHSSFLVLEQYCYYVNEEMW